MKANEAPEKIYLSNFDIEALPKNEQLSERWHEVRTQDTDIEYTRTDAFMKKTENFLEMLGYGFTITDNITHTNYDKEQLVEDFRNYIKEE